MPGAFLYGYDDGAATWLKLQCDSNGKLKLDSAALFEDTPSDGETSKGPTSNWAYDHAADASAHHAKYTDAESRAAIGNQFDSSGVSQAHLDCGGYNVDNLRQFLINDLGGTDAYGKFYYTGSIGALNMRAYNASSVAIDTHFRVYHSGTFQYMCTENVADSKIVTHKADASAHHSKYTDAEAKQAVNLDGTVYWAAPAMAFISQNPDTDQFRYSNNGYLNVDSGAVTFYLPVHLPDGASVTGAVIYGNATAANDDWTLVRIGHDDGGITVMATAKIDTEDTTISGETIDNSNYAYYFYTDGLSTGARIHSARISFTV